MGWWGIRSSMCAALALGAFATGAGDAVAAIPQGNLVVNGDAEGGPGATDAVTSACPPAWTCTPSPDGPTAVRYGTPEFPDAAESRRIGGGLNFFAGGPNQPTTTITQIVDLAAATSEINAGQAQVTVSACLGGKGAESDSAIVTASFTYDGGTLGQIALLPVTRSDRSDTTRLLLRSASGPVAPGTQRILLEIRFDRIDTPYNDGYADNVTITMSGLGTLPPATTCIGPPSPPPPPPPGAVDKSAAKLVLSGARLQRIARQRAVIVRVTPNEAATVSGKGTLSVPGASKVFRVKRATKSAAAGQTRTLRMRISSKAVRAVRRALRRKRKVRAVIGVTAVDRAGNKSSAKRRVRARR